CARADTCRAEQEDAHDDKQKQYAPPTMLIGDRVMLEYPRDTYYGGFAQHCQGESLCHSAGP
ncbi:MAG: hypothetical protein J4N95_00550, partial [Chloroflexi bacterium]|nr:hypothetical protein [Chloroflexota bacterium]